MKVLIVDDSMIMRMTLSKILTGAGHEVIGQAVNGLDGIEKYKQLRPDLVTMDITMPEMDGIQSIKGIRAFDPTAKIIVISAMGQEQFVVDALSAGARDFVVKPIEQPRFLASLEKLSK